MNNYQRLKTKIIKTKCIEWVDQSIKGEEARHETMKAIYKEINSSKFDSLKRILKDKKQTRNTYRIRDIYQGCLRLLTKGD